MAMNVAEESLRRTALAAETNYWMLAVFLLGLAAMAWLTVREASLYERRSAIRNLKRLRKPNIPDRERLTWLARLSQEVKGLIWGTAYLEPQDDPTAPVTSSYEIRLRREIDKLVGKEVYHGQKEQL
jgi:hypothetical protein